MLIIDVLSKLQFINTCMRLHLVRNTDDGVAKQTQTVFVPGCYFVSKFMLKLDAGPI